MRRTRPTPGMKGERFCAKPKRSWRTMEWWRGWVNLRTGPVSFHLRQFLAGTAVFEGEGDRFLNQPIATISSRPLFSAQRRSEPGPPDF